MNGRKRILIKFNWRPKVARFWNRTVGKLVPRLEVRDVADLVIDASPVDGWAEQVAEGDMTVEAWQQAMRDEIRRNYIEQYLAGHGGTGSMTQRDYGSIGGMIAEQYRWLDGFARRIVDMEPSAGLVANWARMYINSAREAYERAQRRAAKVAGLRWVRWLLDPRPDVEHCDDCKMLASKGWKKADPWPFVIGGREAYPGSGDTICLTSCRCKTDWRKRRWWR